MLKPKRRELPRYGIAFLSVGATLLIKLILDSFIQMKEAPFLFVFGGVMVSAWYGGRGPGILATVLSAAAVDFFFLGPNYSFFGQEWETNTKLFLFVVEGTLVSLLGGMLRESQGRKAAMLETATDGVITIDEQGKIVEFNPAAEQIFGHSRSQAIGKDMAELIIPPRLHDQHRAGLRRYLDTGEGPILGQRIEMPALRSDGSEFPVELAITRIPCDGPPLFTGFVRDISERNRAQDALRESEERYRHLVHALPEAVYTCDQDGRVSLYNKAAVELWGRQPELGKDFWCGSWRIYRPDGTPLSHDRCPMALALREGRSFRREEIMIERPDGSRRIVLANPEPILGAFGAVVGAINMLVDITERKQAEEALRQSHAELQSHAEELGRFNRVAVGRELHMIELKKEVNKLCQRQGEAVRYPLDFGQEGKDTVGHGAAEKPHGCGHYERNCTSI